MKDVQDVLQMTTTAQTSDRPKSMTREELEARNAEKMAAAIAEDAKALKQGLVNRLMQERGPRTKSRTFKAFDPNKQPTAYKACRAYVENGTYETGMGLLMMGTNGTGKTHLACAISNYLLASGTPALYDTWAGHLQKLKDEFEDGTRRYLNLMKKADMLVIDDLGKDKGSEWNDEILYEVINSRYEHCKPVIVTTNKTPAELEARDPAVYSRLCEMTDLVVMTGRDYRKGGDRP